MLILCVLVAILFIVLLSLLICAHRQSTYWKRHNIPNIPAPIVLGNFVDVFLQKCNAGELFKNLYNHKAGKNQPVVGINIFHKPALLIKDLGLIKKILIRDFNKFPHRYCSADSNFDYFGHSTLFTLRNPEWKIIRNAQTPFFSSGKLKHMFALINDVGKKLDLHLLDISKQENSQQEIELRNLCSLYTADVIASIVFGLEANSIKNSEGEFHNNGKNFFTFSVRRAIQFTIVFFLPKLRKLFNCTVFTEELSQFLRNTTNFAIDEREKSGTKRNDFIDTLIHMKSPENRRISDRLTFEGDVIVSQTATFFLAGFESPSSAMSFSLYELSKSPELQKKLREEIRNVLQENDGDVTYEAINNMSYLHAVICETLRMYAPLPFLDRVCTDEIGYSLQPYVDFRVPNGMPVIVPVTAIQSDPEYYPNPEVYDPERFMPSNRDNITPCTHLAFGLGPHDCIGKMLGLVIAKVGLVNILKNHWVTCAPRSKEMKFDTLALSLQPKDGIFGYITRDPLHNNYV